MAEGQEPTGGQGSGEGGQESTKPEGQEPAGGQQGGGMSREDALAAAESARREAAATRTKLREAEQKLQSIADEQLTAGERLEKERDAAKRERDEALARALKAEARVEVSETAAKLGFREPALAHRLIDYSEVKIENGKVTGVKEQLEALAKDHPSLVGASGGGDGGEGGGGGAPVGMSDMIRAAAGR